MMKEISGGVCAAQGFKASGVHCGVKAESSPEKRDLALILSEKECTAAGVYTLNRVKAAPIYVTMDHLENGVAWGIVANSGNANACCPMSHENAEAMCLFAAQSTGREAQDFVVASTGVIGQTINIQAIQTGLPKAAAALSSDGSGDAAAAIMTTDTVKKEIAVSFSVGGREVRLGAIAKGSGMIHPNMGTMLAFLTTDCAITTGMLEDAIREVCLAARDTEHVRAVSFNFHTPYPDTENLALSREEKAACCQVIAQMMKEGAPVFNLKSAFPCLIENRFPTPCHQCVVMENGRLSTCGRCIEVPGLCERCGYFFVAEYTLLFRGNLRVMLEMLRTYLRYI